MSLPLARRALGVLFVASVSVPANAAERLFEEGFETHSALTERWNLSGSKTGIRQEQQKRAGVAALRLTLDRDRDEVPFRAELRHRGRAQVGGEYWYGLSLFVPDDWTLDPTWDVVTQWHASRDAVLGEASRRPVLALIIRNDQWVLSSRWDDRPVTPARKIDGERYRGDHMFRLGNVVRGAWTDWVFRIKWSFGDDGVLEVWKNADSVLAHQGPNTFNDVLGPYLKFGLYKAAWKPKGRVYRESSDYRRRTLLVDEVRMAVGANGLALVAPWLAPR